MEDSIREVVEGEVEIMRSAYSEEFCDLREKDVWKVPRPPDVQITLGPHHSQGGTLHSHIKVVLRIITSENYPHEPAIVIVESVNGLSDKEKEVLTNQLNQKAHAFAADGMVVMLELCQHTQHYLSEHARPYTESIYEEMVAGQESRRRADQKAEEEIRRQQEIQEEQRRTIMEEEVARVKKALEEEERQRRVQKYRPSFLTEFGSDRVSSSDSSDSLSYKRLKGRSISEGSNDSICGEPLGSKVIHFPTSGKQERIVVVVGCISERRTQNCYIMEGQEKGSSEKCVIYEWQIKPKRTGKKGNHIKVGQDMQLGELLGKFSNVEKEMSSLLRLSSKNLIHYLGMKVCNHSCDGIQVSLLQEYIRGMPTKYYLDLHIPLSHLSLLRHITEGTLCAINYLHQNNVVHRDLRDSCIYLDSKAKTVRVGDYGVERKIAEMVLEFVGLEMPALYPHSPGRGGKKGDIYRLGLIILSLFLGERVQQVVPSLPASLTADLRDFLQRCLEVNEQERWTAERLLLHPFVSATAEKESASPRRAEGKKVTACVREEGEDDECCTEAEQDMSSEVSLHLPSNLKGHSRLGQEYEVLESLGRGGFGHVFKVRNKVDDRIYALKRIQLDQQSEVVRKKIIREVKLLSSLNHENVVRYYTSWIEELIQVIDEANDKDEGSSSSTSSVSPDSILKLQISGVTIDSSQPSMQTDSRADKQGESEWSIVFQSSCTARSGHKIDTNDESDEEEEDDDDWLMESLRPMLMEEDEVDDHIEFNKSEAGVDQTDCVCDMDVPGQHMASSSNQKKLQFLYIQMQLCEKSTLRQAINKGLHLDEDRIWRLVREIVNGLGYIHAQNLIHRDLKPGNIFLDSADHVKIGDFGLATAALKVKTTADIVMKTDLEESREGFLTGQVGTTLYIAPEITKATGKVSYTNKVDIYSLGIIFFEMIYPPLSTGMERVKVLSDLRKPDIVFPRDVPKRKNASCIELIRWLLKQDPQQRPTTCDILKSPLLPPPTAEEQKFVATLEAKLENVRSADYQEILNLVFKPSARPELEATFEVNHDVSSNYWYYWKYDYLQSLIVAVFKAHGAIWVPTSFYVPKGSFYNDKDNLVSLMARRGELVSAQYDLRYPFARFVARNNIKAIRRYCIDRVQRSSKVSGIHPKETYECAFDIISSRRELCESAARVLLVAQDIIQLILPRRSQNIYIRLGHMDLVQVILNYCGIEGQLHSNVISLLKEWNAKRMPLETVCNYLCDLGVGKPSVESIKGFLLLDGSLEEVVTSIQNKGISRRKNLAGNMKQVLAELVAIKEDAQIMGIKCEIKLRPLLVADAHLYSGFTWQFLMDVHRKKGITQDLLAQGGSYHHLILEHRRRLVSGKKSDEVPSAAGVSLFLEKFVWCVETVGELAAAGRSDLTHIASELGCGAGVISVMVCAIGPKQLKDRVHIVCKFRAAKITADHCHCLNQRETEALLEEGNVSSAVILTAGDKADVRIFTDPTGRTLERKVPLDKVPEFVLKSLGVPDSSAPIGSYSRTDSRLPGASNQEEYQLNIQYITRKQSKSKDAPKLDQQIQREVMSALTSKWAVMGGGAGLNVDVWAVELDKKAVLTLASLDTDSSVRNFNETVTDIKSLFPDHKDYLDEICKMIQRKIFFKKKAERSVPLVLYSIPSNTFKRII